MNTMTTIRTAGNTAHDYVDRAAEGAEAALTRAQELARRSGIALRDGSRQVRERTLRASAASGEYVREHPLQTLVIGVAAVAFTLAVVSLLRRSR